MNSVVAGTNETAPLRVAMVDPSLFTLPYDRALAAALAADGHQVTLHGRRPGPDDSDGDGMPPAGDFYRIAEAWPVRALPSRARLAVKGADHLVSMLRLLRRLRRSRPDVIHFQWLPLPVVDARLLRPFRRVAPLVATVHDSNPFNGDPSARLQARNIVGCYAGFDRIILHTAQGIGRLAALGLDPACMAQVPHGPMPGLAAARGPDSMDGPMVFTLFGKLKPYKGADLLVEAFGQLPDALRRQVRARIVGKAYMDLQPLRQRIRELGLDGLVSIEDRFVRDDEIPELFGPGTVAVFPYRELDTSGVLPQALANGRPLIASSIGIFAESLCDGVHGHLVPRDDAGALARAMRHMAEDRAFAARCARNAGTLSDGMESWTSIARRTEAVYRAGRAGWQLEAWPGRRPPAPAGRAARVAEAVS